jgi:hypothetical protein
MSNRKFKVRVWSKALERFLTKDEWFLDFDGNLYFQEYDEDSNQYKNILVPEDYYVVQQYTGLLAESGRDIYEGDIIKVGFGENKGSLGKAIFEYGAFMLTSKYGCNFMDTYKSCLYGEVIGNIFENKELLQ